MIRFFVVHPDSIKTKTLSTTGISSGDKLQRGRTAQNSMFWNLVPGDVIGKPAKFTNADCGFMWRVKKDTMGIWTKHECGSKSVGRIPPNRFLGNLRG